MSTPKNAGKYRIINNHPIHGQVIGDNATVHHYYPPGDNNEPKAGESLLKRVGRSFFLGLLNTFLLTLFADWGKIIITMNFGILVGPHAEMSVWQVASNIAHYSFPWPFYIGLLGGIITILYYLITGKNFVQSNK